jgi:hypothetical protein
MLDSEIYFFLDAVKYIVENIKSLEKDYIYIARKNEFSHKDFSSDCISDEIINGWYQL